MSSYVMILNGLHEVFIQVVTGLSVHYHLLRLKITK